MRAFIGLMAFCDLVLRVRHSRVIVVEVHTCEMLLQVALLVETHLAGRVRANERFFKRVHAQVRIQLALTCKDFEAQVIHLGPQKQVPAFGGQTHIL